MMANGWRHHGHCKGGPLSPLLSNILLTDLDRELEVRTCRFAGMRMTATFMWEARAGQRIMERVKRFSANRLKLTVNEAKSAVERPRET